MNNIGFTPVYGCPPDLGEVRWNPPPTHERDEDCTVQIPRSIGSVVGPRVGQAAIFAVCTGCGVLHGLPCPKCGGRAFHRGGCEYASASGDPNQCPSYGPGNVRCSKPAGHDKDGQDKHAFSDRRHLAPAEPSREQLIEALGHVLTDLDRPIRCGDVDPKVAAARKLYESVKP